MSLRQTPRHSSPLRVRISDWRVVEGVSWIFPLFSDRHVEFRLETTEGDRTHEVWRRYSDFQVFHETLEISSADCPARLPGRRLIGNFSDPAFLEDRKFQLEEYLRRVISVPRAVCSAVLWNFLGVDAETCLVPRLVARPENVDYLKAVETLALDPASNFRLHNRALALTLLEILSARKFPEVHEQTALHSALVILRSMVIGNFFLGEQFILPLLRVAGRATTAATAAAGRGLLLDLVEKFPDTLFFFFQRELGVEIFLQEISDHDRSVAVVSEVLWLGVAGSQDACIALTEKNSQGPELFVSLAKKSEKFPGVPVLLAASICVLARTAANAQPRLLQVLERVVHAPGNFRKFPGAVLGVLFRSERGSRKILEIFDREDLPSRFACLLIAAVARTRPELLPVRRELGEQLLKALKISGDGNFRSLAAETLLTVAGYTETLLSVEDRSELMKFVIGNLKRKMEGLRISLATEFPLEQEGEETREKIGNFEGEISDLLAGCAEVNRKREKLAEAGQRLKRKFRETKQSLEEISGFIGDVEEGLAVEMEDAPEVFDRLNMEEAEIRSILEALEELKFEEFAAVKEEFEHFKKLETEEKDERRTLRGRVAELKRKLEDLAIFLN